MDPYDYWGVPHPEEYPPEKVERLCRKYMPFVRTPIEKEHWKMWEHGFSQEGQDLFLARAFGLMQGGTFVEVGAHDGETFSNSWVLENCLGWRGVCIEANPGEDGFPLLKKRRPLCKAVNVAVGERDEGSVKFASAGALGRLVQEGRPAQGRVVEVPLRSFASVLREAGVERADVLSIDCEGCEAGSLRSLKSSVFDLIIAEFQNPSGNRGLCGVVLSF